MMSTLAQSLRQSFQTPLAALLSVFALLLSGYLMAVSWNWLVISAIAPAQNFELCKQSNGFCWPFLVEKLRFITFGTYPFDAHWRPALASLILCALSIQTGLQMIGRGLPLSATRLILVWIAALGLSFFLMAGGALGLQSVDSVRWNGLPILLILSVAAIALAFPLGVLLALAREQKTYGGLARLAAVYIEVARGIPMLTVLFVAIFVLPLTLPPGTRISPVSATMFTLILFHAAYFAEDVRGGLRSLHPGQGEAAQALGLSYWKTVSLVVLPQAIHRSLPSLVNSIIGAYKDTSLVVVVGIHDLTSTARMAFSDPNWRGFALEAYFVVGVWFFVSCAFLSWIGRELHRQNK